MLQQYEKYLQTMILQVSHKTLSAPLELDFKVLLPTLNIPLMLTSYWLLLLTKVSFHVLGLMLRISSPLSASNIKRQCAYQVVFLQAPRKAQNKNSIRCGSSPPCFPGLEQPKRGSCNTHYFPILFPSPSNDNAGNTAVLHTGPLGPPLALNWKLALPCQMFSCSLCPHSAPCQYGFPV